MPPTCAGGSLPYICRARSHQSSQQHVVIFRTAGKPYREDVAYRHVSDPKCRCEKHECKEWQQYRCLRKKRPSGSAIVSCTASPPISRLPSRGLDGVQTFCEINVPLCLTGLFAWKQHWNLGGHGGLQLKADKGTEGRFFRRHRTRVFTWRFSPWWFVAMSFLTLHLHLSSTCHLPVHVLVGISSEVLASALFARSPYHDGSAFDDIWADRDHENGAQRAKR